MKKALAVILAALVSLTSALANPSWALGSGHSNPAPSGPAKPDQRDYTLKARACTAANTTAEASFTAATAANPTVSLKDAISKINDAVSKCRDFSQILDQSLIYYTNLPKEKPQEIDDANNRWRNALAARLEKVNDQLAVNRANINLLLTTAKVSYNQAVNQVTVQNDHSDSAIDTAIARSRTYEDAYMAAHPVLSDDDNDILDAVDETIQDLPSYRQRPAGGPGTVITTTVTPVTGPTTPPVLPSLNKPEDEENRIIELAANILANPADPKGGADNDNSVKVTEDAIKQAVDSYNAAVDAHNHALSTDEPHFILHESDKIRDKAIAKAIEKISEQIKNTTKPADKKVLETRFEGLQMDRLFPNAVMRATFQYLIADDPKNPHGEARNINLRDRWKAYLQIPQSGDEDNFIRHIAGSAITDQWNKLFAAGAMAQGPEGMTDDAWLKKLAASTPKPGEPPAVTEARNFADHIVNKSVGKYYGQDALKQKLHEFYCNDYRNQRGRYPYQAANPSAHRGQASGDFRVDLQYSPTYGQAKKGNEVLKAQGGSAEAAKARANAAVAEGSQANDPFASMACDDGLVNGSLDNTPGSLNAPPPPPPAQTKDRTLAYKYVLAAAVGATVGMLIAVAMFPLAWVAPLALVGALVMVAIFKYNNKAPGSPQPINPPKSAASTTSSTTSSASTNPNNTNGDVSNQPTTPTGK